MTPMQQIALEPARVETIGQLERLRQIRNACRDWMTHHTAEIGWDEQLLWWGENRHVVRVWLYAPIDDVTVGFGMLRPRPDGGEWVTLGVLPGYRGRGIGALIYDHLAKQAHGDAWAEIWYANTASLAAAHVAGYVPDREGTYLRLFVRRKDTP